MATERMRQMLREHIANSPRDGDLGNQLDPRDPIRFYSPSFRAFIAGVEPGHGFARKREVPKPIMTAVDAAKYIKQEMEGLGKLSLLEKIDIANRLNEELNEKYSIVKTPITKEESSKMVEDEFQRIKSTTISFGFGWRTDPGIVQVEEDLRKSILETHVLKLHIILG